MQEKYFPHKYDKKYVIFWQNTWRAGLWKLKFFMKIKEASRKKTSQNDFFHSPALHCENAIWIWNMKIFAYCKLHFHNEGLDCLFLIIFRCFFRTDLFCLNEKFQVWQSSPSRFFWSKMLYFLLCLRKNNFSWKICTFYTSQKNNDHIWTKNEQKQGYYF